MESSEKSEKDSSFSWNDDSTKVLTALCLRFQSEHGRDTPYKWKELLAEFERIVGKKCSILSLKNKFDTMKKDWRWLKYLNMDGTSVKRDSTTGNITADASWWEDQIREERRCAKFRNKGIPREIEKMWDRLFGGTIPTGQFAVAFGGM